MRPGRGGPYRSGSRPGRFRRGRFAGSAVFGNPYGFYPDYDYGDYGGYYDFGYESQPLYPPQPYPPPGYAEQAAVPPPPSLPPVDPLMIEDKGDEWVRVTNIVASPASAQPFQTGIAERVKSTGPHAMVRREQPDAPAPDPPPAVLVFRDGHQEEVKGYTIMGGTVYASADYWTTGSWTRQIRIAQLDVPATVKLNQQRGVKFSLPSGPGEIIMRP